MRCLGGSHAKRGDWAGNEEKAKFKGTAAEWAIERWGGALHTHPQRDSVTGLV
jgi:hypothetical protein